MHSLLYKKGGVKKMYTILVNDEHELVTTVRERIMQRSKLINKLHFLVPQNYDDLDMSNMTVTMEYTTPISREYHFEILTKSSELYKDYLEYVVPFDTALTKEAGDIELQLGFVSSEMLSDGKVNDYVRKTSTTTITIVPIAQWSLQIPDDVLTPLDQRLLMLQHQIEQIGDMQETIIENTPDGLVVDEDGKLSLGVDGESVGNKVDILMPRTPDDDGTNDGLIEL